MIVRAVRVAVSTVSTVVPPRLAWKASVAVATGSCTPPNVPPQVVLTRLFASKAEAGKPRVSKKKARQMKAYRRVLTPTEEVLPPHQVYAAPGPEPEVPYIPGSSRRVGVLALKCGMLPEWDAWGVRRVLTVLKLEDVRVVQVKTEANDGFNAIQVGAGLKSTKRVNKPLGGHFDKAGITPRERLAEFRVSEDALLPIGTPITARHFVPGQYVDATGTSAGKGFAGVMKRWNFSGQRATHGVSKTHRHPGSTGQSTSPGKVWKGTKMAGRLGGERCTVEGLRVYKIDLKRNLVYVEGSVPGKTGTVVRLRDCNRVRKQVFPEGFTPPFPTWKPTDEDLPSMEAWSSSTEHMPADSAEEMRDRGTLPVDYEPETPYEIVVPPPASDPFAPEEGGVAVV